MLCVSMSKILIRSVVGVGGREDIWTLTSEPLCLSSSPWRWLCGGMHTQGRRRLSYCNEEKCLHLAWAVCRWSAGQGEGALSGSFFLIKDSVGGGHTVTLSSKAAFLTLSVPQAWGGQPLPSGSPHHQGSHWGQVSALFFLYSDSMQYLSQQKTQERG
jgi:hypothetical protein